MRTSIRPFYWPLVKFRWALRKENESDPAPTIKDLRKERMARELEEKNKELVLRAFGTV